MINRDRVLKLLRDFKEWEEDFKLASIKLEECEDAVKYFGRKADKNRKIYNGMLKTYFYSFMGPKPPKKG